MACMICVPRPGGGISEHENNMSDKLENIRKKSYWGDPDISQKQLLEPKDARC